MISRIYLADLDRREQGLRVIENLTGLLRRQT